MGVLLIFLSVGLFLLYQGTSGVDIEEVFVKEGVSVILHTDVKKNQQDIMKWYFNDTRIAQINGDQSKICTDVQCNNGTERFRGRLKLDHQTGSLTITNTRNTDSGEYTLVITSSKSKKIFNVTVHDSGLSPAVPHSGLSPAVPHSGLSPAVPDSGLSPGFAAGISITVLLLVSVAVAAVIYYCCKCFRNDKGGKQQGQCLKKSINEVSSLMTGEKTAVI